MIKLPRLHLPELEDLPYFPPRLREMMTDCLSTFHRVLPAYDCVVPYLVRALERCETSHLFDFGSGSGLTTRHVARKVSRYLEGLRVTLTDLYPRGEVQERETGLEIRYLEEPVDLRGSRRTEGFRTIFTAFHHLPPGDAKRVLADAVLHEEGIGVFEVTERSLTSLLTVFITPFLTWILTPILPFSWGRLLLTYVIPIIPLAVLWDGIASIFRSYSTEDLRELAADFEEYDWSVERQRGALFVPVTLLIGTPRR